MESSDNVYNILMIENSELTAEAKYVLIQVYKRFGNRVVNEQVKALAQLMRVTDKAFKKARDLLFKLGYLVSPSRISNDDIAHKAGRPNIAFQIPADVITGLNQIGEARQNLKKETLTQRNRIDGLLFQMFKITSMISSTNKGKKIPLRQSGVLTAANRLVMAILLLHADECGAVRGLAVSMLARYAGMERERLDSQLKKLTKMGYILTRESGVTGKRLFSRSIGAFFLNVFEDESEDGSNLATLILMQTNIDDSYRNAYWGWRILREADREGGLLSKTPDSRDKNGQQEDISIDDMKKCLAEIKQNFSKQKIFDQVIRKEFQLSMVLTTPLNRDSFNWTHDFHCFNLQNWFKDKPIDRFAPFLQMKINEYAANLLSQYWDDVVLEGMTLREDIIEKIKNEIYPVNFRKKTGDLIRADLVAEALGIFIYRISFETALHAKSIVHHAFGMYPYLLPSLASASYALLPVRQDKLRADKFAIVVKFHDKNPSKHYITIDHNHNSGRLPNIERYNAASTTELYRHLQHFGYHALQSEITY